MTPFTVVLKHEVIQILARGGVGGSLQMIGNLKHIYKSKKP